MKSRTLLGLYLALTAVLIPACSQLEAESLLALEHASVEHGHQQDEHSDGHDEHQEGHHHAKHKVIVSSPVIDDVVTAKRYVCQIHSCRHIEVAALERGYLDEIPVNEGQHVKQGDLLFRIVPTVYQAELDAANAEAQLVQIEYNNTQQLFNKNIVSQQEVALAQAKLDKANASVRLAKTELDFASIRAPFDGVIDRLLNQKGSLLEEGAVLTTLSDNSTMWVYFNVPEADYLDFVQRPAEENAEMQIELELANGSTFGRCGKIAAIEADFDNETGNIAFRADFPNPNNILRHGQTGNILLHRPVHNAVVIPQRATFEILAKRYVYVLDENNVVHQREIEVQNEMDDIYVLKGGLTEKDKIVWEGTRQVRDGEKVEYEFRDPSDVLSHLKNQAE